VAKWGAIDRNWNIFWGHPDFRDMGQVRQLLQRGLPTEEDMQVFQQLSEDPRFKLVYRDERDQQAVFERIR
jgi:hypothetical protein